jgi:hypothetical protein
MNCELMGNELLRASGRLQQPEGASRPNLRGGLLLLNSQFTIHN